MKITFDILAATEKSGGMRLHATEILKAWLGQYPEDGVVVVGPKWAKQEFGDVGNVRFVSWPNEKIFTRAIGQILITPVVGLFSLSTAVVSLSPIVSPLVPRARAFCFQHDWRHIKNPHEFPQIQRLYRKLWQASARHAGINFCISKKTQLETLDIVPTARTRIVPNGGDHAREWLIDENRGSDSDTWIVTFGHHNNKRPELVIEAFASIHQHSRTEALVVLGARGEYAETLRSLAVSLGVGKEVRLPGFVNDNEYHRLVAGSKAIVLASSDEGFGLPVAEADYFGIPAVVTSDSGLDSIFDGLYVAAPTSDDLARHLERALDDGRTARTMPRKTLDTWSDTVRKVRSHISDNSSRDSSTIRPSIGS